MNTKQFLEQAIVLEQSISSRLEEIKKFRTLAEGAGAIRYDRDGSQTQRSFNAPFESPLIMAADLERDAKAEIKELWILDSYMQSENGSKTPNAALWMSGGKRQSASGRCTASFDRRHGVIRWEPEHGEIFERKVVSETQTAIEDEEGYLWFWPEQEEE